MVQLSLPSGNVLDFGDASDQEIERAISTLRAGQPELFEEVVEEERMPPPDLATASIEEVQAYYGGGEDEERDPGVEMTHAGEIESLGFQYDYGEADNDRGRAMRLEKRFGEGTFAQDNNGYFYLLLDKISPELKKEYNLQESGTMYVNRPGGSFLGLFDFSDVAGFAGGNSGSLLAGTGAALMATGLGLIPGSIVMGLAMGGGKAVDELIIENAQGLQDQTIDEVYGDIATEALFGAGTNVVLGAAFRLARRLIKGPGKPDGQVISQLMDQGLTQKQALHVATQVARTKVRGAIKAGAVPTMYEATGKPIAGRLQAIYEGIFPNRKAALANRDYVNGLFDKYSKSELSEGAFKDLLEQNADDVTRLIQNAMKDPDKAVEMANTTLRKTISKEIDFLIDNFQPGSVPSAQWQKAMGMTVKAWQAGSANLYKHADSLLGKTAQFDKNIIRTRMLTELGLREIVKKDGTKKLVDLSPGSSTLATLQGLQEKPIINYILNKKTNYTLNELNTLRHTLRSQGKDPELVGSVTDHQIKNLVEALDNMITQKADDIGSIVGRLNKGGSVSYKELGIPNPGSGFGSLKTKGNRGQVVAVDKSLAIANSKMKGFELLQRANKQYSDGAELYKSGAANMLFKNIDDGYFDDLIKVVSTVVENNNPLQLQKYLKLVTPKGTQIGQIEKVRPGQWRDISDAVKRVRGGQGNVSDVNKMINSLVIDERVLPRLQTWLDDMPVDQGYRKVVLDDFLKTIDAYADQAAAVASPEAFKNINRSLLSGTWLRNARDTSKSRGTFDPDVFAQKFNNLGREVQDELFGKKFANDLRNTTKDFFLVAKGKETGRLNFINQAADSINNKKMADVVRGLQNDLAVAERQSQDALFQAVRNGTIVDADSLVQAAVKNPRLVDSLRREVGEDVFNSPGGLRDMTMQRIVKQGFPEGITDDAVASGKFAQNMERTILKMNEQGGLSKILGAETVRDLRSAVKMSEKYASDLSLKGKGGLASAAFAAGIGMRIIMEPVSAMGEIASIMFVGRMMRNRTFLKWMTKPTIRARDYKAGLNAISERIMKEAAADGRAITKKQAEAQARNELGELNIAGMRLRELAWAESRMIGALQTSGAVDSESRESIGEAVSVVEQPIRQAVEGLDVSGASLGQGAAVTPALGPEVLREQARREAGLDRATILGVG
tara:strand:+ start:35 stop:3574 length:3540 start_codon:yes stop_codon:yes gene_type:complete